MNIESIGIASLLSRRHGSDRRWSARRLSRPLVGRLAINLGCSTGARWRPGGRGRAAGCTIVQPAGWRRCFSPRMRSKPVAVIALETRPVIIPSVTPISVSPIKIPVPISIAVPVPIPKITVTVSVSVTISKPTSIPITLPIAVTVPEIANLSITVAVSNSVTIPISIAVPVTISEIGLSITVSIAIPPAIPRATSATVRIPFTGKVPTSSTTEAVPITPATAAARAAAGRRWNAQARSIIRIGRCRHQAVPGITTHPHDIAIPQASIASIAEIPRLARRRSRPPIAASTSHISGLKVSISPAPVPIQVTTIIRAIAEVAVAVTVPISIPVPVPLPVTEVTARWVAPSAAAEGRTPRGRVDQGPGTARRLAA